MIKTYNYDIVMDSFGQWLRSKRKDAKLTQGELSNKSGVSVSYISTLEREQPHSITGSQLTPAVEIVDALATALKANNDEARQLAGYAPKYSKFPEEIAAIGFEDLDSEDIQEIAEFIRFKKSKNRRVSPERKNDIQEIDNEIPFSKL